MLGQVGLDNIDVVIAAFEDDGRNVIAALQARQLKLEKVVAIVQNHEYTQLLEQNNVVVVNAPWATAAMVENILDNPVLAQLFEFGIGAASLLEVSVPENAKVNGGLIRDLEIPKGCLIAAIMRNNQFVVPRGIRQSRSMIVSFSSGRHPPLNKRSIFLCLKNNQWLLIGPVFSMCSSGDQDHPMEPAVFQRRQKTAPMGFCFT